MERAAASMRRAQEPGAMYYGFMRHDPRLERAWQHPDFAAVMEDTRQRIATSTELRGRIKGTVYLMELWGQFT